MSRQTTNSRGPGICRPGPHVAAPTQGNRRRRGDDDRGLVAFHANGLGVRVLLRMLALFSTMMLPLVCAAGTPKVCITILHTNDLHQSLAQLPRIAGYVAEFRQAHPNTVFIDAGDWFDRGSSLALITRGGAMYGAMARMGYDMWLPGNHDWAYGGARLQELMRRYPVPVLGSNLGWTEHPLPKNVAAVLVKEFEGVRVGFFGITLDTYGQDPKGRPYIHVLESRRSTRKAVNKLKRAKVDLIVAVTHLGFERMKHEGKRRCPTDLDLAGEYPDIDVIVGGHSHTRLTEERVRAVYRNTGTIIVQAGASGRFVGKLTLRVDPDTGRIDSFDSETVPVTARMPEQAATADFLASQYAAHMPNARRVVATLREDIERYNAGYWYAEFLRTRTGADLVLLPVAAFYKEPAFLRKGPMTVERLRGYFFDKYLISMRVVGRDLRSYLANGPMLHRLNPLHDRGRPFSEDAVYIAGFDARFDKAAREVLIDLDPEREYTLVTPWFHSWRHLSAGADNGLPSRSFAESANPLPGLVHKEKKVLSFTSMKLLLDAAMADELRFYRKYTEPRSDWGPWKVFYETERKVGN
ncbi:MAG: bifunctional metallophosphatase/5'-nucleotidase [Kiritimatiellaeota bacterium]|nr:bifunctional metallophosphatase/5'-nucleotidase [Kiritimatiellota bacterium]